MRTAKPTIWIALALSILVSAAVGCGKKDEGKDDKRAPATGKETTNTGEPATKPPEKKLGPHAGFDLDAMKAKLQGTWLIGGRAFSRVPTIWHFEGDKMTIIQGEKEENATFEIVAPCHVVSTVKTADSKSSTYHNFVFDGDTLYSGLGNSGIKSGNKTVACLSGGIYVFEGGKCVRWEYDWAHDKWKTTEAKCEYTGDEKKTFAATDTSVAKPVYGTEKLKVHGNVLLTLQMKSNKAEKIASLEAAKKRAEAAKAAKK